MSDPARTDGSEARNDIFEARSDLLILDAQRLADGPLATVRLPFKLFNQIHGWWVPQSARRPV